MKSSPERHPGSPMTSGMTQHREDIELITHVRAGHADAFEVLYLRHRPAAEYIARAESDNASDRDDTVAEAFASVFHALRSGKGPDRAFRSYLFTAVRRIAHRKNRKSTREHMAAGPLVEPSTWDEDILAAAFNSAAVTEAFNALTKRWQLALWYLDVHDMKPAEAAPLLGLSPNAVSALVLRAREGLRTAYLQAHTGSSRDKDCADYIRRLGAYARNALQPTPAEQVRKHLQGCPNCTAVLEHLNDVESSMRTRTKTKSST